jgi:hypothetical protein
MNVLLEIFDFYVKDRSLLATKTNVEAWKMLVHVCRRWRSLVFRSPHRLNLRLLCTPKTPSRDTLDIWPALPLLIRGNVALSADVDNIVVALRHSNRVCDVTLWETGGRWQMEKVLAAMQVPFPELTDLELQLLPDHEMPLVFPDSFLGGSAPCLRVLGLTCIPFPGLPKLLLSATHLVNLHLDRIPHSGYISPEAMAAPLSVLSSLKNLSLEFESHQSRPDWGSRRPPPLKRSVIPSLTRLFFKGVSEYLEDLVTCIDAPQLGDFQIVFFNQIDFDTARFAQFIGRTSKFRARDLALVQFDDSTVSFELTYGLYRPDINASWIEISCKESDWQLSSIAQVCNSFLPTPSIVEDFYVERERYSQLVWKSDGIENTLWLELLLSFTAVKNLYLGEEFAPGIAAALQELVGARIAEVLPNLQNIFVKKLEPSGRFQENLGQFVVARRLSDHPVATSVWNED